jgi:hypothetical protein
MGEEVLRDKSLLICTDSQSAIAALESGPIRQDTVLFVELWRLLLFLVRSRGVSKVTVQFVASHCGVQKNERVDEFADQMLEECKERQNEASIPLSTTRAWIKTGLTRLWKEGIDMTRFRAAAVAGKKPTTLKQYAEMDRRDAVVLAQLRTGQSRLMGPFRAKVLKLDPPKCRWCGGNEETVEHLFNECIGGDIKEIKERLKVKDATVLHSNPELALLFLSEANVYTHTHK